MKIISLIVSVVTLFSVFSVATPVLATDVGNINATSSSIEINDNDSLEIITTTPTESTDETGVIYDPEIDTAIDPCEFCSEDDGKEPRISDGRSRAENRCEYHTFLQIRLYREIHCFLSPFRLIIIFLYSRILLVNLT